MFEKGSCLLKRITHPIAATVAEGVGERAPDTFTLGALGEI